MWKEWSATRDYAWFQMGLPYSDCGALSLKARIAALLRIPPELKADDPQYLD